MLKINNIQNKLFKAYLKKLKFLNNKNSKEPNNNLSYFILYLQYLRDFYLLSDKVSTPERESKKVTFLIRAILEFQLANTCIYKYFNFIGNVAYPKADFAKETAQEAYLKEYKMHWELFWRIVSLNIGDWFNTYDTI